MNGISNVPFNSYSNAANFAPKQKEIPQIAVTFRGNDYPYYNEEPKQKHNGLWIMLASLLAVGGGIAGLGYAHKTNAISKLSDGKIKNFLLEHEDIMKTCHEWCSSAKEFGNENLEKVKSWFN